MQLYRLLEIATKFLKRVKEEVIGSWKSKCILPEKQKGLGSHEWNAFYHSALQ